MSWEEREREDNDSRKHLQILGGAAAGFQFRVASAYALNTLLAGTGSGATHFIAQVGLALVTGRVASEWRQLSWLFAGGRAEIHARGGHDDRASSRRIAREYGEDRGKRGCESAASSELNSYEQADRR